MVFVKFFLANKKRPFGRGENEERRSRILDDRNNCSRFLV